MEYVEFDKWVGHTSQSSMDKQDSPTALVLFKCCHRCDLEQQFTLTGGSFKETASVFIK